MQHCPSHPRFHFPLAFYVWQSDTKCVGEVRNCVGEMKRSVGEMKQTVGETKRFVGEMKQIWWGDEATWWGNEAKCVGEMPHRQSEITPSDLMVINAGQLMHTFSDKSQQELLHGLFAYQVDHERCWQYHAVQNRSGQPRYPKIDTNRQLVWLRLT